jgi:hypothetical protein
MPALQLIFPAIFRLFIAKTGLNLDTVIYFSHRVKNMTAKEKSEKEKERSPREFLPMWANVVLGMAEDAQNHKAGESSSQEES